MKEGQFIYKKDIDWSVLQQGFTIPVSIQVYFQQLVKETFPSGATKKVKLIIDGEVFLATLVNQKFDLVKYPNHKDIIQFRYEPTSETALKMQIIFKDIFEYCIDFKKKDIDNEFKKRPIPIPENIKAYFILYTTNFEDTFLLDYITNSEQKNIENEISKVEEEEFEMNINKVVNDDTASIVEVNKLSKIRKLDKSIAENLKMLYQYKCQITGEEIGKDFNTKVVEAHHIEYFTKSLNNDSNNIIIINPNFHRIIHKTNPIFDRNNQSFHFPNGVVEKIKLNLHL